MPSPSPLSVFCVDDDPSIRALVKAALEKTIRATVTLAESADHALVMLATMPPPDVFLLDVMMPGTNGYELCRALRRDGRYHETPVVFLSAMSDNEGPARAAGGDHIITKPFAAAQLGKQLLAALGREMPP